MFFDGAMQKYNNITTPNIKTLNALNEFILYIENINVDQKNFFYKFKISMFVI